MIKLLWREFVSMYKKTLKSNIAFNLPLQLLGLYAEETNMMFPKMSCQDVYPRIIDNSKNKQKEKKITL